MYSFKFVAIFIGVLCTSILSVSACKGFDIRSTFIKNCDNTKSNLIRIMNNSSIYVNQKCEVISNVCIDVAPFTGMEGILTVKNGRLTFFNASKDLCTLKNMSDPTKFMEIIFGRKTCKMEPGIHCYNNTKVMDIKNNAKYFQIFGVGTIDFHEDLQHKEGESCFNGTIKLSKL